MEVFFDIETYKEYSEITNQYYCTPYAIGVWYWYRKIPQYREFWGVDSAKEFIWWLIDTFKDDIRKKRCINVYAFNIGYDLGILRYFITEELKEYLSDFRMKEDETGKFLSATLDYVKDRDSLKIYFGDLYMFHKGGGSYKSRLDDLFTSYKQIYPTATEYPVTAYMYKEPITVNIAQKGEIDYDKTDLYQSKEKYPGTNINVMYYTNRKGNEERLDLKTEQEYLRIDVFGLHLIHEKNNAIKNEFIQMVSLEKQEHFDDIRNKMVKKGFLQKKTVSGVSKFICGEITDRDFDSLYRCCLGRADDLHAVKNYRIQKKSLIGGLTIGTSNYLDVRNKKIESYDVNSLYPYIMMVGIPCDSLSPVDPSKIANLKELHYDDKTGKLSGDYVIWCWVKGTTDDEQPYTDWKKEMIWKGKKIKLPEFDNKFFGLNFLKKNSDITNFEIVVLKNYYELLDKCCDHNFQVIGHYYQLLDKSVANYIKLLMQKKEEATKEGHFKYSTKILVPKIAMNSLYGKAMEGDHPINYVYGFSKDPDKACEYTGICKVTSQNRMCGLKQVINEKRELPNRTGGLFVSSTGRLILLSSIFNEIANGNEFIYADTDSMKLIINKPVKIPIHDTKMGLWKYEGSSTHCLYPGKHKRYLMYDLDKNGELKIKHMALAGIPISLLKKIMSNTKYLKHIFSHDTNVMFINMKVVKKMNDWIQPVLVNTTIMTNNLIKPTHIIWQTIDLKLNFAEYDEKILESLNVKIKQTNGKKPKWQIV